MKLPSLTQATLIKRYKRFLADVTLADGTVVTVHCPNTGAMTGCADPGSLVWLSISDNPKRKYPYTWELVQTLSGDMACVHSAKANEWVKGAIENRMITELLNYDSIRKEVKYGEENSRIDLLLERKNQQCFVEVKSVTLLKEKGLGVFPDAVSDRGRKHLRELIKMVEEGHRAVLFFCVQHSGIDRVAPADSIDNKYADTFREAIAAGVEVLAYKVKISPPVIRLVEPLRVLSTQY
jgi:sugar fermentation stimulation protein A